MNAAEITKELQAKDDLIRIAIEVMDWWDEHKDDKDEDGFYAFAHHPYFVKLAQQALEKYKK